MPTLTDELTQATAGLLFPSETDAPIEPFIWNEPHPFSPAALRAAKGDAADTPITTMAVDDFFGPTTIARDWHGPAEQERVRRFRALVDLLKTRLQEPLVYKLGAQSPYAVFVVGRTEDGATAGLTTQVVET